MWFKTRVGLVCVEGTTEFQADRWTRSGFGPCVGVYAYQARHPEGTRKGLFGRAETYANRKIYLACMPADGGDAAALECMRRIEAAVRADAAVCDLSDVGTVEAWGPPDYGVMMNWTGRDPPLGRYA